MIHLDGGGDPSVALALLAKRMLCKVPTVTRDQRAAADAIDFEDGERTGT